MGMKEEILEKTAKEYFESAEDELKKGRYNSAVVLFFKSLVALADLYVLQQTGETPSSHTGRFRITQDKFPEVFDLLDKDFPFLSGQLCPYNDQRIGRGYKK